MALPKALLCSLGDYEAEVEEQKLRQAGFATASLEWRNLIQHNDWMQLTDILEEPGIVAWVFAGEAKHYTKELICMISLLTFSLTRGRLPEIAMVFCDDEARPAMPEILKNVKMCHSLDPFAAKLMGLRSKPPTARSGCEFYLRAHLDPLLGLWLEVGPAQGQSQENFMAGVLGTTITAFGIGEKGVLPGKCTLTHPMLGIEGEMRGTTFSACASKDRLDDYTTCYCKIDKEIPLGAFLGMYPDQEEPASEVSVIPFC